MCKYAACLVLLYFSVLHGSPLGATRSSAYRCGEQSPPFREDRVGPWNHPVASARCISLSLRHESANIPAWAAAGSEVKDASGRLPEVGWRYFSVRQPQLGRGRLLPRCPMITTRPEAEPLLLPFRPHNQRQNHRAGAAQTRDNSRRLAPCRRSAPRTKHAPCALVPLIHPLWIERMYCPLRSAMIVPSVFNGPTISPNRESRARPICSPRWSTLWPYSMFKKIAQNENAFAGRSARRRMK